jgi:hypothetical protein
MSDQIPEEKGEVVVTAEDAQRILQKSRADRIQAVEKGIQDLCNAHRCVLDIQFTFSLYGQPQGRIVVLPKD